jgi:hypothetical protein
MTEIVRRDFVAGAAQKPNDARGIANVRSDLFGADLEWWFNF